MDEWSVRDGVRTREGSEAHNLKTQSAHVGDVTGRCRTCHATRGDTCGGRPRGRIREGSRDLGICKSRGDSYLDLLQKVFRAKMGARRKTLRQIYVESLSGGDGPERSRFPEIVGASIP